MLIFSEFIYNFFLSIYYWAAVVYSSFDQKAKSWIIGQKVVFNQLKQFHKNSKTVWIHASSLGEFEQARTLIEKIKNHNYQIQIVVTFFSPSGYEIRKNYELADVVCYLPLDSTNHAKQFIQKINPDVVLWIKYDFWFYYLKELNRLKIPTFLVSANFREEQIFFRFYGAFFKNILTFFTKLFVQNDTSKKLLSKIKIQSEVIGDTRFDRVIQIANSTKDISAFEKFKGNKKLLIMGSSWHEDEVVLIDYLKKYNLEEWKIIIVPHVIKQDKITKLKEDISAITSCSLFSEVNNETHILILDKMGWLSTIYRLADVAWIGGGFGVSVHNVLEAAVYGIPTMFGSAVKKSNEALELIQIGSGFIIKNEEDLHEVFLKLADQDTYLSSCKTAKDYVANRTGATEKIWNEIVAYF